MVVGNDEDGISPGEKVMKTWGLVMLVLTYFVVCILVMVTSATVWLSGLYAIPWYNFLAAFGQFMVGLGALVAGFMYLFSSDPEEPQK